jgi:catechol 2,3-dioxygenase-like lactoylglutathione lyase family enzyme
MLIDGVSAILLISPNAKELARFYSDVLGLPLEDEVHEGVLFTMRVNSAAFTSPFIPRKGGPGSRLGMLRAQ